MAIYVMGESHMDIHDRFPLHRVGRDGIPALMQQAQRKSHGTPERDDVLVLIAGEVDCRCHVHRQINEHGRPEETVLHDLAARCAVTRPACMSPSEE
jgi:hypothetical protein